MIVLGPYILLYALCYNLETLIDIVLVLPNVFMSTNKRGTDLGMLVVQFNQTFHLLHLL